MMYEVAISSKFHEYIVSLGSNSVLSRCSTSSIAIVDQRFEVESRAIWENVIILDPREDLKSLNICQEVIKQLHECGANRYSTVVAIGGGYVQDIATFVCSIYMRGINWTYIPTTWMSILDSCIGGKSSINVGNIKNLVGNIYPPTAIVVGNEFAPGYSPESIASGLCESIKICYARGSEAFARHNDLLARSAGLTNEIRFEFMQHVIATKKWFIEEDEFDTGVRQLLNFGHTFGHALESATRFHLPHGIAIGVGMLCALESNEAANTDNEIQLSREVRRIIYPVQDIIRTANNHFDRNAFIAAFERDKKHDSDNYSLILSESGVLMKKVIQRNHATANEIADVVERTISGILDDHDF